MAETGLVLEKKGSNLKIKMERTEACAKCRACINGLLGKEMILSAKNECNAQEGDTVSVEINENSAINAVLILYGIPLIFLLVGVFSGYNIAVLAGYGDIKEFMSVGFAAVFLYISYLLIKYLEKRINKHKYMPVATKVIER